MTAPVVGRAEVAANGAGAQPGREGWGPLPRRARPRWTPALLAIRAPVPRRGKRTLMVLSIALPLLAWVVLSATEVVQPKFLPSPRATLAAGIEMARSGQLWSDFLATTERVLYGYGLAVLVSVPLGILMGAFAAGEALFGPIIGLVRYMPPTAFIPLLFIYVGVDEAPKIALLFIGTVFFNTLMTANVVRDVPSALVDVSYTLGAHRGEVLRKVVIPHALPGMIDSIRVNFAAAWNLVVVAELITSIAGLGKRISLSQRTFSTDKMFALLVVIGVVGVMIDFALRLLRDRVGRWAP